MRSLLLAAIAMCAGVAAVAQPLAENTEADIIRKAKSLPTYHSAQKYAVGCFNFEMLQTVKSELAGHQPYYTEAGESRLLSLRCTFIPDRWPVKIWQNFKFTGYSGLANGPGVVEAVVFINPTAIRTYYIMRDDLALEPNYISESTPH